MRFIAAALIGSALFLAAATASSALQDQGVDVEQPTPESVLVNQSTEQPLEPVAPAAPSNNVDLSAGVVESVLQPLIVSVQQDLALQLGLTPADIEVLEARSVVWQDDSLGCPIPGTTYVQGQVEGVLVRLRVGDRAYEYHTGGGRIPFLCDSPAPRPAV